MRTLLPTERRLAFAATLGFGAWVLYAYLLAPAMMRIETLERVIPQKEQDLQTITQMSSEIEGYRLKTAAFHQAIVVAGDVTLHDDLSSIIIQAGLNQRQYQITDEYSPPRDAYVKELVTVEFDRFTEQQLSEFLGKAKALPMPATVESLIITPDQSFLEGSVSLSRLTYHPDLVE